jgi:hypothetical protein
MTNILQQLGVLAVSRLSNLGLDLHVECLQRRSRAPTVKRMPIIGNITAAVHRLFGSS